MNDSSNITQGRVTLLPEAPTSLTAAIVLTGPVVPAWQAELIAEAAQRLAGLRLLWRRPAAPRGLCERLLVVLTRALAKLGGADDPFAPVELATLPGRLEVHEATGLQDGRPCFAPAAILGLDLAIILPGGGVPAGEGFSPRLGCLAFEADPAVAALEAAIRFRPVAEAMLVHIAPDGSRCVTRRLASPVDPLSLCLTVRCLLAKARLMAARALAEFNALGSFGEALGDSDVPVASMGCLSLPALGLWLTRSAARAMALVARGALTREQWFLTLGRVGAELPRSLAGTKPLYPPQDRGYADPFLIERGGEIFIFFEEIELATGKGVIAAARLTVAGGLEGMRTVLARDHHLSYPFVFEHQGETYMMPEAAQSGRLDVYRAVEFPWRWEFFRTILTGHYVVDGTILEYNGGYWLFAGCKVPGGSSHDELYLFTAESPFGPYRPHPRNPVVSDVRHARPAGRIVVVDGKLIRPAQDCSLHYGRAVEFREITMLSATDYRETGIGRMTPGGVGGNRKAHAYERLGGIWAADGLRLIPFRGGG